MSDQPLKIGQRLRRASDGQLGFLIEEDGKHLVKLDRRAEKLVEPYTPHRWLVDETARLTQHHIAVISYAADRQLREARGEYGCKEFRALPENDRIEWMKHGPPKDADVERWTLWHAVKQALAGGA